MRAPTKKRTGAIGIAVATAAILAALSGGSASAATVTINLCAVAGTTTIDGHAIPIWGFVDGGNGATPSCGSASLTSLPGPGETVTEGDTVTVNVENDLPASTNVGPIDHTVSLEIPGISLSGPSGVTIGNQGSWTFTATNPGSFLYQSGGDSGRQVAMGLYGALIVNSATPGHAYDDAAQHDSSYSDQATLVLSQIDPLFNADPDHFVYGTGDFTTGFRATYWLINGQPYTGTPAPITHTGSRLLLRLLNAGYDNTSMSLLGIDDTVVGRGGTALKDPIAADNETIPAGGTEDAIVDFTNAGAPPSANGYPLFNRELHVTNGAPGATAPDTGGGMLTFIAP